MNGGISKCSYPWPTPVTTTPYYNCGKCSQQGFLHGSVVKNPPVNTETQETQVHSLGQENLEEEMATHSSILAWKNPWTEEPGGLESMGSQRWNNLDAVWSSKCKRMIQKADCSKAKDVLWRSWQGYRLKPMKMAMSNTQIARGKPVESQLVHWTQEVPREPSGTSQSKETSPGL